MGKRANWLSCRLCGLAEKRKNVVLGVGRGGGLVLVGEAPGAREDETGAPFVGPSGVMLNHILKAAGIAREEVFITNVVACRPTDRDGKNRAPMEEEIEACKERLADDWCLADPAVLILLGNTPVQVLTRERASMSRLAGKLLTAYIEVDGVVGEVPAFPCWHPSFLLRVDASRQPTGYFGRAVRIFRMAKELLEEMRRQRKIREE